MLPSLCIIEINVLSSHTSMLALEPNIEMAIINSAPYVEADKFQDERMLRNHTARVEPIMKDDSGDTFSNEQHYR